MAVTARGVRHFMALQFLSAETLQVFRPFFMPNGVKLAKSPKLWRRWVMIANGEYQGWPPRVVRGVARHAAIASSLNQTVKLPRWRKLASYAAQFVTLRFCFGIWWRRTELALNGMVRSGSEQGMPPIPTEPTPLIPDPCNNAAGAIKRASQNLASDGDNTLN